MATDLWLTDKRTNLDVVDQYMYRDAYFHKPTGAEASSSFYNSDWQATGDDERLFYMFDPDSNPQPDVFYSERAAAPVTIAGQISFSVMANVLNASFVARLRAKLYKVQSGRSDYPETFIGQADAPSNLPVTTPTAQVFTFTPGTAIELGTNERIVARFSIFPPTGAYGLYNNTGAAAQLRSGAATATSESKITFTETITYQTNGTLFRLKRTALNGIGNFFDLLPGIGGSASTTGVVNTVAGGTEIQWTRTAGGTVLEFISPRVKAPGFRSVTTDYGNTFVMGQGIPFVLYANESATAANCGGRVKIWRRKPDGTETLVFTSADSAEFGTSPAAWSITTSVHTPTDFNEDDRLVLRVYIVNVGTMGGSRTCTLTYDHNVASAIGDARMSVMNTVGWKAESDPPAQPPTQMTMTGIGI